MFSLIKKIIGRNCKNDKDVSVKDNCINETIKEDYTISKGWFENNLSVNNNEIKSFEPETIASIRLNGKARDIYSSRARSLFKSHKVKVNNQWINSFQSINAGNGNAHLSTFTYQPVNYYECYLLAQDAFFNNIFDILSTTPFAKGGRVIYEDTDNEVISKANSKFKVNKNAINAVRSSFVVGGCLLYMDFGLDNLEEPLNLEKVDYSSFKGFIHIDPINCVALDVETIDVSSDFYMKPKKWYVVGLGIVHSSHFIKFEENIPELVMRPMCMYFGMPLTQLIKQDIANSNLASQGVANLIGRFRNVYLKSSDSSFGTQSGAQQFKARLETMALIQDNFSVMPLKLDEEIIQLTTTLSGLYENVELFYQLVSARTSIPVEKLLGKSSSGLNATGEGSRINFYDKVRNIQSNNVDNMITMYSVAISAVIGKYIRIDDYIFNELEEPTQKEKIEMLKNQTDIAKTLVELGAKQEDVLKWLSNQNNELGEIEFDDTTEGLEDYSDIDDIGNASDKFSNNVFGQDNNIHKAKDNKQTDLFDSEALKITNDDKFKENEHPRDKDGKFTSSGKGNFTSVAEATGESETTSSEINAKIEKLSNIDWNKDNILPNLNKETLKKYELTDKPVLLKKNIIKKNKLSHPDITEEMAKRIIGNALYKPEAILKANKEKTAYHNFITRTDDEHSDIVLLELSEEKENYEVVNYHVVRNEDRERKERLHDDIIS